jgi:thiamine-phosphate pyrophosphorylase
MQPCGRAFVRATEDEGAPREQIISVGRALRAITRGRRRALIVNDDPYIASESSRRLHLGQDDMPLDEARRRHPSLAIFGLSTHNEEQARRAAVLNPDYCGVGPV